MVNTMDKNTIYKAAYEVIKESVYWGEGDKDYGTYVKGIVDMTDKLSEKLDKSFTGYERG